MYNETKRLFRTFDDIEKFQKRNLIKNLEYIFVDDGSSDDSIKKVLNFFKNKKKIKYKIIDNNSVYFGSRNLKYSEMKFKFHRKILGIFFSILLRILFQIDIKDTQCGFKLYKKKVAKHLFNNIKDTGFVHDVEVVLLSRKFNYGIKELPVTWIHRNESKLNLYVDTFKMFYKLFIIKKNLFSFYK